MNINIDVVKKEIFRACDIRGIVNKTLTSEVAYLLGLSFGTLAQSQNQNRVVIGRDGRHSGAMLLESLTQGLMATGCEIIDLGQVPTPVVYFATHLLKTGTGIMITGSHNPPDYNGFKMMLNGDTLAETQIEALYQIIQKQEFKKGTGVRHAHFIIDEYIQQIKSDVQIAKKIKLVVDCGNGVVGVMAEKLFSALGCDVVPLFCDVDGNFPNHHPDPGQPKNLQDLIQAVVAHQADLGLAFDGDGDRLGLITEKGEIIWPDRLMMLFSDDLLKRNPGSHIIFDVKCSKHLAKRIKENGGQGDMYKTGHSLIKKRMKELNAQLAGEMSGHFFFKERWYGFDDATYAGARLLEIVAKDKRTLSEIFASLPNSVSTPEINIGISEEKKFPFIEKLKCVQNQSDAELITVDGLRVEFKDGWGLVRASNTTPCLVLRFEADDTTALDRIKQWFKETILQIEPQLEIPF